MKSGLKGVSCFSPFTLARSKFSYVLLAFFSSLALLGATAANLDLIGMLLTGEWQDNSMGVAIGLFGVIVTAMITLLFRNLFSQETRAWVWNSEPIPEPSNISTQITRAKSS